MNIGNILYYAHYTIMLLFGILLSVAYTGIQLRKRSNNITVLVLFAVCGILQLASYVTFNESLVWKIYPLIVHLPIVLVLCLFYRRNLIMVFSAVSTAYLCCQPAKWLGILCNTLTHNQTAELLTRIVTLFLVGFIALYYLAPYLSKLFQKEMKSVCIFGSIPMVYYLFDYTMGIYTNLWTTNNQLVAEFLPFFLCIVFMFFCFFYYKEYEQKSDAEHKEQIIRIAAEQQAKELKAIKRSEQEIRLLRHDMRLILNTVTLCIQEGNFEKAYELLSTYSTHIDGTKLEHFCNIDTINYILSDFVEKCKIDNIDFKYNVELQECKTDEILFSSILSNALDNALNAQKEVPVEKRMINLMLKDSEGKLLLSVKNTTTQVPVFVDGLPITTKDGHGYGSQSIRYMTERLGGNYQFKVQNNIFSVRVII